MEISKWKTGILNRIGKYKYVMIVILAGAILMILPDNIGSTKKAEIISSEPASTDEAGKLATVLSMIQGAGRVEVYLSVEQGERTIYQTDNTYSENDGRLDRKEQTVLVSDQTRREEGLILQRIPAKYSGAVVIAQGGADPGVKLAIVEAVSKATGLGADKISVLKMK